MGKLGRQLVALLSLAVISSAPAKEIILKGLVQDTSRNVLPGVVVTIEGTDLTRISDDRGEFSLPLNLGNKKSVVLQASKETYLTLKQVIGSRILDSYEKSPNKPLTLLLTPIVDNNGLLSGTLELSMSHAIGFGTIKYLKEQDRSPEDGRLDDGLYENIRRKFGERGAQQVRYRVRLPEKTDKVRGIFLISEHGLGGKMMSSKILWDFADKNHFAMIGFTGNPIQRGMYPAGKLDEIVAMIGNRFKHPEFANVPVITFGHSNGTGFSAFYAALRPERTICWISYHSGGSWHLQFPGVELSPGLVMHGTKDPYNKKQHETVLELRNERGALITMMMECDVAHWPRGNENTNATFEFIVDFSQACIDTRLKNEGNQLVPLEKARESAWLGDTYDMEKGGRQKLSIAPTASYKGDRKNANYLPTGKFAEIWQRFSLTGK